MLGRNLITSAAGNAGEVDNSWDVEFASFQGAGLSHFKVADQDTGARGLFIKSDGLKMYHAGFVNDNIYEYNLSTAWDISSATYVQSLSVSSQDSIPYGVHFKTDGTKMYVNGTSNDKIYEYDLSTAWDISTATYNQDLSVSAKDNQPNGLFFKSDGLRMYLMGGQQDSVHEYALSTAWDISTATFDQSFSVSSQEFIPEAVFFKPDGTEMYVTGRASDTIHQYALSTAWDVSTASFDQSMNLEQATSPVGLFFKSDGTRAYITDFDYDTIYQYTLPTAWETNANGYYARPTTDFLDVENQDSLPQSVFFKEDGLQMYVCGYSDDNIVEYSLSTAWDITTASVVSYFSVASEETQPLEVFFKTDGAKMYIVGDAGDEVNEYNLSTAWDSSTATYNQNFSTFTQDTRMQGLFFKSDGLKMYTCGATNDKVYEYDLSTAWDISTASINDSFSVSSQEIVPQGLYFKSDGTRLYVIGNGSDGVNQYNLSTAWDITTASFDHFFDIKSFDDVPRGIFFKPDGTEFFTIGTRYDSIYKFTIS